MSHDSKATALFNTFCIEFKEFINLFMGQPESDKIRMYSVHGDTNTIYNVIKTFNNCIADKNISQATYNYFKGYTKYLITMVLPYWHYCISKKIYYIPHGEREWKHRMLAPQFKGFYELYVNMVYNVPPFNVFKCPFVTIGSKYKQLHPELFK
jgi:hypothetical protein